MRDQSDVFVEQQRWLQGLACEYEAGDLTALLEGLLVLKFQYLGRHEHDDVEWLLEGLRKCVVDCLKREPVNATTNRLAKLEAVAEDYVRAELVLDYAGAICWKGRRVTRGGGGKGWTLSRAYDHVAKERASATGAFVSAGAIRQSCRRAVEHNYFVANLRIAKII